MAPRSVARPSRATLVNLVSAGSVARGRMAGERTRDQQPVNVPVRPVTSAGVSLPAARQTAAPDRLHQNSASRLVTQGQQPGPGQRRGPGGLIRLASASPARPVRRRSL
jgi:hypothetical protein